MIRSLLYLLLVPVATAAAADPVEIFGACAYTPVLPSAAPARKQPVEIKIETQAAGQANMLQPVKGNARFTVYVTSQFNAYLFLFQDPPDPTTLIFPDPASHEDNHLKKGVMWSNGFRLTSPQAATLLVAVSPIPLPDVAKMSANEVRQYFQARSRCGTFFLQEKQF